MWLSVFKIYPFKLKFIFFFQVFFIPLPYLLEQYLVDKSALNHSIFLEFLKPIYLDQKFEKFLLYFSKADMNFM